MLTLPTDFKRQVQQEIETWRDLRLHIIADYTRARVIVRANEVDYLNDGGRSARAAGAGTPGTRSISVHRRHIVIDNTKAARMMASHVTLSTGKERR